MIVWTNPTNAQQFNFRINVTLWISSGLIDLQTPLLTSSFLWGYLENLGLFLSQILFLFNSLVSKPLMLSKRDYFGCAWEIID